MAASVLAGGPAIYTEDQRLLITGGEMAEEAYFTFSQSLVHGDDGGMGGLLNTVQETTAKVQGERQTWTLHELATRTTNATSEDEVLRLTAEVLSGDDLDFP